MSDFDYTAALKGSKYARENEKPDAEILKSVRVPSVHQRIARQFETTEDDPRVQEMLTKITAKGYDPSEWLDFAAGKRTDPPARRDLDRANYLRPDGPVTADTEPSGAITHNPINLRRGYELADLAATRAADAATAGLWSRGMQAANNAIEPGSGDADAEARAQLEAPTGPGIKNTTLGQQVGTAGRALGYLSPVGIPAMVGKVASKAIGGAASKLPEAFRNIVTSRPVLGAATGSATGAGVGASEATVAGEDILPAAGAGALFGGAVGGAAGAASAGLSKLGEAANKRIDARRLAGVSDGAPAGKRDKLVGRGGEKAERIVTSLNRDPELDKALRGPNAEPVIDARLDGIGAKQTGIYQGVQHPVDDITKRLTDVAIDLQAKPATRGLAEEVLRKALDMEASWGKGNVVDAAALRQEATDIGKNLFRGNPNVDPTLGQQVRQKLYGEIVDTLRGSVEKVKPGVREELVQLDTDMSDLLNIRSAIRSRDARAKTPSTTLQGRADRVMDWGLGLLHPGAFLAKKGLQKFGPGTMRILDEELASTTVPGTSSTAQRNPILGAREQERERDRRRSAALRGEAR